MATGWVVWAPPALEQALEAEYPPGNGRHNDRYEDGYQKSVMVGLHAVDKVHAKQR